VSETAQTNVPLAPARHTVLWLQSITLVWMLIECGVSLYSVVTSHSVAVLAFGVDSFVELLSATVVLLRFLPVPALSERHATRLAAVLLFVLAAVVLIAALLSLLFRIHAAKSLSGIAITLAALLVMPILASFKRRESRRTGSSALAADAAQSATCAWLAFTALLGLAANALFGIWWLDSAAALIAIPLLLREARTAWRGETCACC